MSLTYNNTEFGDDIILTVTVQDADNIGDTLNTYILGRLDSIRYEDNEDLREVRGVGSKFRLDARTTNFRGVFRCRFKSSAINMRLLQLALGALMREGSLTVNDLLAENLQTRVPSMLGTGDTAIPYRYVAPFKFDIKVLNMRTNTSDTLKNCVFTRRSKDVSQGDFTIVEMEGEYSHSELSSYEYSY